MNLLAISIYASSAIVFVAVIKENFIEKVALELGPENEEFFFKRLLRRKWAFQGIKEEKKPVSCPGLQ